MQLNTSLSRLPLIDAINFLADADALYHFGMCEDFVDNHPVLNYFRGSHSRPKIIPKRINGFLVM